MVVILQLVHVVIEEPPIMTISTIAHPVISDFQYMGVNEEQTNFLLFP